MPAGDRPRVSLLTIHPGFLRALGIPLVGGRDFGDADGAGNPRVAIVNRSFARAYLDGEQAIGNRLRLDSWTLAGDGAAEIVGVAEDVRHDGLRAERRAAGVCAVCTAAGVECADDREDARRSARLRGRRASGGPGHRQRPADRQHRNVGAAARRLVGGGPFSRATPRARSPQWLSCSPRSACSPCSRTRRRADCARSEFGWH